MPENTPTELPPTKTNETETIVFVRPSYAPTNLFTKIAETMPAHYLLEHHVVTEANLEAQLAAFLPSSNHLHLVAHSVAAPLAYRFASEQPARVRSLCLLDGFAQTDAGLRLKLESILAALNISARLGAQVAAPWFFGGAYAEHSKSIISDLEKHFADPSVKTSLEAALNLADARKWLRGLQCPSLIALGSDDALTPMRYSHEIVEWVKPGLGVLITITGAGHCAALERPEEFSRILAGFVSRHNEFTKDISQEDPDFDASDFTDKFEDDDDE